MVSIRFHSLPLHVFHMQKKKWELLSDGQCGSRTSASSKKIESQRQEKRSQNASIWLPSGALPDAEGKKSRSERPRQPVNLLRGKFNPTELASHIVKGQWWKMRLKLAIWYRPIHTAKTKRQQTRLLGFVGSVCYPCRRRSGFVFTRVNMFSQCLLGQSEHDSYFS